MVKNNYPKYPPHKIAHDSFRDNIKKLKRESETSGVTIQLAEFVRNMIGDWFFKHIRVML